MLSRRLPLARPFIAQAAQRSTQAQAVQQIRHAQTSVTHGLDDPNMNGGYVNPVARKRALRDPYGDWWDMQERRNFGEPVHEDNDVLGVFSTEPYTHAPPGRAAFHLGVFVAAVLGLCGVVYQLYPDRPSVPRAYPGALEAELGGPTALVARQKPEEGLEQAETE